MRIPNILSEEVYFPSKPFPFIARFHQSGMWLKISCSAFYHRGMNSLSSNKPLRSEAIETAILLAVAGGIVDVITYMERGHVFATAQAGNLVFLAINLTELDWKESLRYALPVLFFMGGVLLTLLFKNRKYKHIYWKQLPLALEIILISCSIFLSHRYDYLANILCNAAAGIQLSTFKYVEGYSIPSTMVAGDIRNGTTDMLQYAESKDVTKQKSGKLNLICAACFLGGAITGNWLQQIFSLKTMWIAVVILCIVWVRIGVDKDQI